MDASVINEAFVSRMGDEGNREKLAKETAGVIRDHLLEDSIVDKVTPPVPVTRADLQVTDANDTLYKMEEVEPQSTAMTVTMRGQGRPRLARAGRFPIGFYKIESDTHEANEMELMAYSFPITKVLEQKMPKDMGDVQDRAVLLHWESAVQKLQEMANSTTAAADRGLDGTAAASGTVATYGVTKGFLARQAAVQTSYQPLQIQPVDLIYLFNLFPSSQFGGGRLRANSFLLGETEFNFLAALSVEDVGNKIASETFIDGFKYSQIQGRKFIRTVKTDILREGNVFAFADSEFGAKNYILQNIKFFIDKVRDKLSWVAWMYRGYGIGNIAWVRKLELYPGSVTPGATITVDTAAGAQSRAPRAEDKLGGRNNRVDEGYTFPSVAVY